MFRKLTLAAVTGLGLWSAAPAANAATVAVNVGIGHVTPVAYRPYHRVHRHYHYRVLYRSCARDPWAFHAGFNTRREANRAAVILRNRGLEVFIR